MKYIKVRTGRQSNRANGPAPRRAYAGDERIVAKKPDRIEGYRGELTEKRRSLARDELLTDTIERRAVERIFELTIQACPDLAKHVAAVEFEYEGDGTKEAIRDLGEADVIDQETTDTVVSAVGLGNRLAHEHGTVDYDEVYGILESSADAGQNPPIGRTGGPSS